MEDNVRIQEVVETQLRELQQQRQWMLSMALPSSSSSSASSPMSSWTQREFHPPPPPPVAHVDPQGGNPLIPVLYKSISFSSRENDILLHQVSSQMIRNAGLVNWEPIAACINYYTASAGSPAIPKSATDCKLHYALTQRDGVNTQPFDKDDLRRLQTIGARHKWKDWDAIAAELGNGRMAWQCFKVYQKYIRTAHDPWTPSEDEHLRNLVAQYGTTNWRTIAAALGTRTRSQCQVRWRQILRPGIRKGPWTADENALLLRAVEMQDVTVRGGWVLVAEAVRTRTEMQCRERYLAAYDPRFKRGPLEKDEVQKLLRLVGKFPNDWNAVASEMGRPMKFCKAAYSYHSRDKSSRRSKRGL